MSKELKKLNHYPELKSKDGIKSVIDYINSNRVTTPLHMNERQRGTFTARYTADFIVQNRKLFYRPNDDILVEVIKPEEKEKKIKGVYNNIAQGLGTGELAFYHMVASKFLPITKQETTAFLKKSKVTG